MEQVFAATFKRQHTLILRNEKLGMLAREKQSTQKSCRDMVIEQWNSWCSCNIGGHSWVLFYLLVRSIDSMLPFHTLAKKRLSNSHFFMLFDLLLLFLIVFHYFDTLSLHQTSFLNVKLFLCLREKKKPTYETGRNNCKTVQGRSNVLQD